MAKSKTDSTGIKSGSTDKPDDSVAGIAVIEPDAIDGAGTTGASGADGDGADKPEQPKRRGPGRPRGSTNKRVTTTTRRRTTAKNSGVVGIEKILYSLHTMAAGALKVDELALDEVEAKALADAVAEVASHYDVTPDPKVVAWAGLIGTCASVYGPRVAAYKMRTAAEKRANKPKQPAPVEQTEHDPAAAFIEPLPVSNLQ